jgi:RHO1 GDP-GTP exchange protein 1/2
MQSPNRKIQRVLLLFAGIIENTEETNRDRETLQKASDELKEIAHECDARYTLSLNHKINFRTGETTANLLRVELDQKLVFKSNPKLETKVELGLKEGSRKVLHRGDVSRKSDNKLEWLDIYLILLDNYLIMTKKRKEKGVERYHVSKQVFPITFLIQIF